MILFNRVEIYNGKEELIAVKEFYEHVLTASLDHVHGFSRHLPDARKVLFQINSRYADCYERKCGESPFIRKRVT